MTLTRNTPAPPHRLRRIVLRTTEHDRESRADPVLQICAVLRTAASLQATGERGKIRATQPSYLTSVTVTVTTGT